MRLLSVCLLSTVALISVARAAPPTTTELAARVDAIAKDIAELNKLAAEFPALQAAVGELSSQLAVLRQDLDRAALAGAAQDALVERLDRLEARMQVLAEEVGALRANVQAGQAPEASPGGGGGGYEDGFVLVSLPAFSLRMNGYAQLRYVARANETLDDLGESGFLLRRARLTWGGNLQSPKLTYKVQLDFGRGKAELLDYYVEGKLPHRVIVRGGQFKTPFSPSFMGSAEQLSFVDRSVATEEFRYDRELGLLAAWQAVDKKLEVTAGVFNGAGKNVAKNDNVDPLLVLRVAVAPLGDLWKPEEGDPDGSKQPRLRVGAGVTFENTPEPASYDGTDITNTDVDADGEPDNVRVVQVGVDAAFRMRGLGIEAEGYLRQEEWGGIDDANGFVADDRYLGAFAQASYFVLPGRVQLGLRYSLTEVSPLAIGGRSKTAPPMGADVQSELSVLAAYYRNRHGIELSAMYSFIDWGEEVGANPVGAGEQRFLLEAQLGF